MHTSILEPLIESPKLYTYVSELEDVIEREKELREQFYNEITEDDKAEFINGEIIYQSPIKFEHNKICKLLLRLMDLFVDRNKLGYVGYEKLLISLTRNDYEPDICFFDNEKAATFHRKQMKFPAPDFIVEILSPSTEGIDRGIKFEDYAAHGVTEYWIVDPETEFVEQYILDADEYTLRLKSDTGVIKSVAIENFVVSIRAIFDETENYTAIKEIMV
jgi:Uma2 family endonuclease